MSGDRLGRESEALAGSCKRYLLETETKLFLIDENGVFLEATLAPPAESAES